MASHRKTIDCILDQVGGAGAVTARTMFGEYGLYCGGKLFALVCDDRLFLKPTAAGRAYAADLDEGVPYPGAKPCLLVDADRWDDREWLSALVRTTVEALPMPRPKTSKGGARRRGSTG